MSRFSMIRLDAGNDKNGNPMRVYVVMRKGDVVATYDEEYSGPSAITNRYHLALWNDCPTFDTSPQEHRELVELGNDLKNRGASL